ncbi:hypothetical protein ACN47E_007980 [Coniothyrium glycines]
MESGWETLAARQAPGMPPTLTPEQIAFNNAPQILSITGTFFALAATVVLMRCYVRIAMLKVFGADDYVMLVAMVLCAATFTCFKLRCDNGLGRHTMVAMMDPIKYMTFSKIQYAQALIVMIGVSSVKVSIALQLLRLSVQGAYTRILYGSLGFIVLMTLACAGTLIFQCLPVEAAWDISLRPPPFGNGTAKCYSLDVFRNLGLMNSAFNIITDVLFASLPVPLIWQLQLNRRTKISLIAVLSLGWFASAAAIVKAVKQWNVLTELDWTVSDSFNVWNFIEFTIGIIAGSIPSLKPLFNWFLDTTRAFTSRNRTRGGSYKGASGALGYENKTEQWNKSIAMTSFPSEGTNSPSTGSKSPYHVSVTGVADREGWEAHRKDSDESILPLQQPRHTLASNGIVMTREVRVV